MFHTVYPTSSSWFTQMDEDKFYIWTTKLKNLSSCVPYKIYEILLGFSKFNRVCVKF